MQPWASLVVMGLKTIETRSWATGYRGPLFIHASKSKAGKSILPLLQMQDAVPDFSQLPFGVIIGEVMLTDIIACEQMTSTQEHWEAKTLEERAFGSYSGKYCWLFQKAVLFDEPIPATGRLGLWEF